MILVEHSNFSRSALREVIRDTDEINRGACESLANVRDKIDTFQEFVESATKIRNKVELLVDKYELIR